jgi:hypothetical protein
MPAGFVLLLYFQTDTVAMLAILFVTANYEHIQRTSTAAFYYTALLVLLLHMPPYPSAWMVGRKVTALPSPAAYAPPLFCISFLFI